jgi:hypothetical protein
MLPYDAFDIRADVVPASRELLWVYIGIPQTPDNMSDLAPDCLLFLLVPGPDKA